MPKTSTLAALAAACLAAAPAASMPAGPPGLGAAAPAMAPSAAPEVNAYMERIPPGYITTYTELYPCQAKDDDNGTLVDRCADASAANADYGNVTFNGQKYASTQHKMWFTETLIRVDTTVAWAPNVTTTTVEDYARNATITYQTRVNGTNSTVEGCIVTGDDLPANTLTSKWWQLQARDTPLPGSPGELATVMRGTEYAGDDNGEVVLVGYFMEKVMPDGTSKPFPRRVEMYRNGTELISVADYTSFTPVEPNPEADVYVLPPECYRTDDESDLGLGEFVGESPFPWAEDPDTPETSIEPDGTEEDDEMTTRLKFAGRVPEDAKWVGDMSLNTDLPAAAPSRKVLQTRNVPPSVQKSSSFSKPKLKGEPVEGRKGVRKLDDGTLCEEKNHRQNRKADRKKINDALTTQADGSPVPRPVGGRFPPGTAETLEDDAERDAMKECETEPDPELECGVLFKSITIRGVADVLIQYDGLVRVCSVEASAALSRAGVELSGEIEVVADPHFEAASKDVQVDGCVRLTVGCPRTVCKRSVIRNLLSLELASVCVKSGKDARPCNACSVEGNRVACPPLHNFVRFNGRIGPSVKFLAFSGKAQLFVEYTYYPYFPCFGREAAHRVRAGAQAQACVKVFRFRKCPVDFNKTFVNKFAAIGGGRAR